MTCASWPPPPPMTHRAAPPTGTPAGATASRPLPGLSATSACLLHSLPTCASNQPPPAAASAAASTTSRLTSLWAASRGTRWMWTSWRPRGWTSSSPCSRCALLACGAACLGARLRRSKQAAAGQGRAGGRACPLPPAPTRADACPQHADPLPSLRHTLTLPPHPLTAGQGPGLLEGEPGGDFVPR